MAVAAGQIIRAERQRRGWPLQRLAERAGVSPAHVAQVEAGKSASLASYARIMTALDLQPELGAIDPRRRTPRPRQDEDVVHAAMGEMQASRLQGLGFQVAMDEPYQHFQFAGRADVAAWDLNSRALLHIENRTRFPNVQEALGSYGAKKAYFGRILAERLGMQSEWRSETHVIVALWSSEVIHVLRQRESTFRAACPDGMDPVLRWWHGDVAAMRGRTSSIALFDPSPGVREAFRVGELGSATRARHRGYADAAAALRAG